MYIQKDIKLSKYSTFKIGGKASFFVEMHSVDELKEALCYAKEQNLEVFILGGGSNVIFPDTKLESLVIKINLLGVSFNGSEAEVYAGEDWDSFVEKTLDNNLYGLENLSNIPGTVGATPIQNVGAYGAEVSDFIKEVQTIDRKSLKLKTFSNKECNFSYRDSFFKTRKGKNFVVTKVIFKLKTKKSVNLSYKDLKNYFVNKKNITPKEVREAVIKIRSKKFPDLKKFGTAGSFFKNPVVSRERFEELKVQYPELPSYSLENGLVKLPLAYILDKICGLTGNTLGGIELYKKQLLVFVNFKKGTRAEVEKLKKEIEKKVFVKTKIKIEPEVIFVN